MKNLFFTLFVLQLLTISFSRVFAQDVSWSFYPNGYIIYNNDGTVNRYHAKLQFSGSNQNIVTDLLWDQLSCSGSTATKVWWINEDHSGDPNYYGFQTSRPENIVHEFGGDFTYHCGCTTTNPLDWNAYGTDQGVTNIIEVPYHIKKFDTDSPNYIVKPSTFHWNPNSLEVQTFKGGLIPPIGAGTIESYGKINLHTGMLPKTDNNYNTVMSYGLSYLHAKNMPNLPSSKQYVTANDGEWATNWNNCPATSPYNNPGDCIGGAQFNNMTTQQAWATFGSNLSQKSSLGVVLQDGEFWNGIPNSQGLANYKYCFDQVIQGGSTTLFGQHHAQPYITDRFFNDNSGSLDAALWNNKYTVSMADRNSLVSANYISAYWKKDVPTSPTVAEDWKIASLQTYTQSLNPTNMYAWIQDLEINKKLFPEWKHLITVEGFHETPYYATVSHKLPSGQAITFTGGNSQWVKQSSSIQEFTGLYSNTIGDGLCYFADIYTRNDDLSNWIKLDNSTENQTQDVYARQFYGVDDYLYLGIWKANEVNRQTIGQTWSKPDISVDGGSTWITGTGLYPASAYAAKRPLVHIINTTDGGKIIMAYNLWNSAYKVQTIKVRDANGVISDVQIKGQFPTLYQYGGGSPPNNLTVSQTTWSAAASSSSQLITVSSNVTWTVSTNSNSWLSVNPTSGSNNGTFTISATSNPGSSSRSGTLTVAGGGLTQTITVTQQGSTTTDPTICLEAESGSGNRSAASSSQASGGQYVGGFGNSSESMSYSFSVSTAGTYPLSLWYNSGDTPQFGIVVNGVLQTASAPGTSSWSGPFVEKVVSVSLGVGLNTIQIQGTGGGNFTLDKLCITAPGSTSCGSTPQDYCWSTPIPAGQIIFRTAAVEVVAGPKSANDSGNPPASGNCWCIQQYAGQPNCYIYPTSTKDMLLPVANTPTAMQYRISVGTGQTGKTAKLYVNGTLTWTKTVTDGELVYPDFSNVTAQSRVYFVIEGGSPRLAAENVEKSRVELPTIVYPNPTDGLVKVVYYLTTAETVNVSLTNAAGKLLLTKPANGLEGQNELEIDMKANPSGVYFLRLQSAQKNETLKVIKGHK